jgi:hypothetical protein
MKKHAVSLEKKEDDWTKIQSTAFKELLEVVMVILFFKSLAEAHYGF